MALHRDFLMRMIERFSAAFFQIIAGKTVEDPEQALIDIEDLLAEALGTKRDFALGLGPSAIDNVEPALAAEVGRLLLLHHRLSVELGQSSRARQSIEIAFAALLRAMERPATDYARLAVEVLRDHLETLAEWTEHDELATACVRAHHVAVQSADWAEAEDWLFFALDLAPTPQQLQIAEGFFDRLHRLSADELEAGGLSEEEVREGSRALHDYRE